MTRILGIDTSCDDTSAAVVENGTVIRSNIVSSQIPFHRKYGGVVPEIASRKHTELILPVIREALVTAETDPQQLEALAVTVRPGLIGSLVVGLAAAKALAWAWQKPLIPVNHIHAHLYAHNFAGEGPPAAFLGLVVSGGHTMLMEVEEDRYLPVGRTVDDAAGEAFDKVAKLMQAGYPGGPVLARMAQGRSPEFQFPRPMITRDNADFSFSGLKTAVRYFLQNHPEVPHEDVAHAFQEAVVDVLISKTLSTARKRNLEWIVVAGGVAANLRLRQEFLRRAAEAGCRVHLPPPDLCTDNAAMIAGIAYTLYQKGTSADLQLNASAQYQL